MLSEFRLKKVQKIFSFYDANENGVLDIEDIDNICDQFSREFSWSKGGDKDVAFRSAFKIHWSQLIGYADSNNDGIISPQEFIQHYDEALSNDMNYFKYIKPFFDSIFPIIDSDNDGVLSKDDYMAFFRSFGNTSKDAEVAFKHMDLNGDGMISHFELYLMWYNFHMSDDDLHPSHFFFGPIQIEEKVLVF